MSAPARIGQAFHSISPAWTAEAFVWGSLTAVYIQAQVCRGAASGAVIALDLDTGTQLWRHDFA